jgi:hypothetical protein
VIAGGATIGHSEGMAEEFARVSMPSTAPPGAREAKGALSLERYAAAALVLVVALGFFLRVRGLDRAGFNEDEVQKVNAARAYLRGDFSRNLEHPMLLKSMIAVSLAASVRWNSRLGASHRLSDEFAVRLPNVIFGALTAVAIFAVANELFGLQVALLSALLWSFGIITIIDNRLAKEDTLLVFFTWLGYYFTIRAKKASLIDLPRGATGYLKLYAAAGACFGLMLASKYFPHYLGLIFLYYILPPYRMEYSPFHWRDYVSLLGSMGMVFLAANPAILFPATIHYMLHYVSTGLMTHHGYLMMGHFYLNEPAHLRGGMPFYFYLLLLAIKTPIPVLLALGIGMAEVARRREEPGAMFLILMFLLWIVPFSLLGGKWMRWMVSWMPAVYIVAAIGVVQIFSWMRSLASESRSRLLAPALNAAIILVFLVQPLVSAMKAGPFYSLYLNPLGRGRTGYYFPHEEFADAGLRPAIFKICREAPASSAVGGEAPPVFAYYFHQCGRDDLQFFSLSGAHRETMPASAYLVIEDGREYFENISLINEIASEHAPTWTTAIQSVPAAAVYKTSEWTGLRDAHESNVTLH